MSESVFDENNHELTIISGAIITRNYIYIAQYFDKYRKYWDGVNATRLSGADLGAADKLWMAHDVPYRIIKVCVWRSYPHAARLYVALSLEGEVELLGPNGEPNIKEHIEGAGVGAPWAKGHGYVECVREIGTSLYACGGDRQVYRRRPDTGWMPMHAPMHARPMDAEGRSDMSLIRFFSDINGFSEDDIYATGEVGDIFHFDGVAWKQIESPTDRALFAIALADDGIVYIVGRDGILLEGNAKQGFRLIDNDGYAAYMTGVACYDGKVFIAANRGLFVYDKEVGKIAPYKSGLKPEMINCHELEARDGVLWSFGSKDLAYFDGTRWTRIDHPDNPPIR